MVRDRFNISRRLWLLTAIPLVLGAVEAVRAVDPPTPQSGPNTRPAPPRWADRLRRWLVGSRSSRAGQQEVRHFDAFEFWALERDERRRR
ncbi:MAG TPA: hypothetical protein VFW87_17585 [Pirellulales bacterium]|nr:hypothetical protein [Pirellulales bacterium]